MICSKDAHKVLIKYPHLDRFNLEKALYRAYPKQVIGLLGKYTDIEKVFAMCNNGYFKYNREIEDIDWNGIVFHYNYLTEKYLNEFFPYADLVALNIIKNFSFAFIDRYIRRMKVRNLWYLKKVLIDEAGGNMVDAARYRRIGEVHLESKKGEKIDINGMKSYVE